jgi:hypothetical protein
MIAIQTENLHPMKTTISAALVFAGLSVCAMSETDTFHVEAGGDLRLRQEGFDEIPLKSADPAVTRGGHNDYFRIRGRVFADAGFGPDASVFVRLCDEFRVRNTGARSYEWPDELLIDQLRLTLRNLWDDRLDVTVGRQDLKFGSGRLFAEGTAKDGSRTSFFDGVKARVRISPKTTLDAFGFYGRCENKLVLGHEHRDLTGLAPGFNGMDEGTAGFFLDDSSFDDFSWGMYYVWLHDTAWRTAVGDHVPHEDIHTAGLRFAPRFSDKWSADAELAWQASFDDTFDRRSGFGASSLKYSFTPAAYLSLGGVHMTGDDPDTERREDFNVLFGRYPWLSELMLYAFDGDGVGTWHNITHLWLECGYAFGDGGAHSVRALAGPVFAPERDGAGGGRERGFLESFLYSFPVSSGRFGNLRGHVFLEVFEPGSYYVSDKTAYFFRWELNWSF